jgi:hypothetical protein
MKNGRLLTIALGLMLATAGAARAQGMSLSNQLSVWVEDSTRSSSYLDYFDLQGSRGPWLVSTRFELDEETRTDPQRSLGISRRFAEYRDEHATLHGGTFYATFGRGLLLRAEEDATVRLDRDIDGFYAAGKWRALDGQLLVGRPRNDDTYRRDDLLSGTEMGVQASPELKFGAGYVRRDASLPADAPASAASDPRLGRPVEELAGGNARWTHGAIDAYLEGAKRYVWGRYDPVVGWTGVSGQDGRAWYGSLTLAVPGYSALLEGKDYLRFDAPYSTLPPANTVGQPVNSGRDERGAGLVLTASPQEDLTLDAAGSYAKARDEAGKRSALEAHARRDWWGRGSIQPGIEWTEEVELESHRYRSYSGPTLNASYYLTEARSLSLHSKLFRWANELRGGRRDHYTELTADLGLLFGEGRAVTVSLTRASKPIEEYDGKQTWASVELDWVFNAQHELKIKAGRERGGVVCSGGVCHYEPAFSGVRFEFTSRL